MGKKAIYRSILVLLALLVAVSAWGPVAAQDNTSKAPPYLGIGVSPADNGVQVTDVSPNSPAADAGLKTGDIIKSINDKAVTADTIRDVIGALAVGDKINLSVQRGDQTLQLTATLAARPATTSPQNPQPPVPQLAQRPLLGVSLEDSANGPVIRQVVPGSPAEKAGLKVNDIITKIGDKTIAKASDASAAIGAMKVGDTVTIEVKRGDQTQSVQATLASAPVPQIQGIPFGQGLRGLGIEYNATDQTWTIHNLSSDSPLYTAGLREGDVIEKFDGKAYDPAGLHDYLSGLKADATVNVTLERDSKSQDISVPASALSDITAFSLGNGGFQFFGPNGQPFQMPFNMGPAGARLGVQFVTLDDSVAKEHNVTQTVGALVTQVVDNSPAADAGLKVNDVITAVDGDTVNAEHTLLDRIATHKPGDKITLDVARGSDTLKLDVTLGQPDTSDFMQNFGDGDFPFFDPNGGEFNFPFSIPQPAQPQHSQPNL